MKNGNVFADQNVVASIVKMTFGSHIQAGLPEQDVFIESSSNKSKVVRVEEKDIQNPKVLAKPVYATAKATAHDPFKLGETPLGPFDKGSKLGFTLGQWLGAIGSGSYVASGSKTELSLHFNKLISKGVYTVWCSSLTLPPNFKGVDKPCGAADGSQNSFKADSKGNGSFSLELSSPLIESTKETVSMVTVAYHSDGKTYADKTGDFGKTTHVQLFYLVPTPKPTPTPVPATPSPSPSPSETPKPVISGKGIGWIIVGLLAIVVIISLIARRKRSSI